MYFNHFELHIGFEVHLKPRALIIPSMHVPIYGRSLSSSDSQSNLLPPINVNIVATGKLTGHMKRRYHDQVRVWLETVE